MVNPHESSVSTILDLYKSDYAAGSQCPRKYTLYNATLNEYITYLVPTKITPRELESALGIYTETCGDKIEFEHENIKIYPWSQGRGSMPVVYW